MTGKQALYAHKNPPTRRGTKNEVEDLSPVCPFGRASAACCRTRCAIWDEDYSACSMSSLSLYNIIRDAMTDAAVDVMRAYKGGTE